MAQIYAQIPDDLDKRFREKLSEQSGFKRGLLSLAIEEAISDWIEKE